MTIHGIRTLGATLIAAIGLLFSSLSSAGLIYKIDIDSLNGVGITTESDWTSLNAGSGSGNTNSVTVGGVTFTIFSSDGSRSRSEGTSDLTRDFVFDDGAGQAVGLYVNGLSAGKWIASVYSFDAQAPAGNQIIGMNGKIGGGEAIYTTNFASNELTPYTFTFDRADFNDGFGVFARENNGANRSRFNALVLREVPVPATVALMGLGLVALGWKRRKKA